jgi:hypothetical protein
LHEYSGTDEDHYIFLVFDQGGKFRRPFCAGPFYYLIPFQISFAGMTAFFNLVSSPGRLAQAKLAGD